MCTNPSSHFHWHTKYENDSLTTWLKDNITQLSLSHHSQWHHHLKLLFIKVDIGYNMGVFANT